MEGEISYFWQNDDGGRARVMNGDEVMKVQMLGSCENFVGKWEKLIFDAFSDPKPVKRA